MFDRTLRGGRVMLVALVVTATLVMAACGASTPGLAARRAAPRPRQTPAWAAEAEAEAEAAAR